MRFSIACSAVLFSFLLADWAAGDAQDDLAQGKVALAGGKLDDAEPLLANAVQELPQSVEAHVAFGECLLKLGKLREALAEFQTVLKLSPKHAFAKQIVDGLTDGEQSAERFLAAAREMNRLGRFNEAESLIMSVIRRPLAKATRLEARFLMLETKLWGGRPGLVREAVQLAGDSDDDSVQSACFVIAALSVLTTKDRPTLDVGNATVLVAQAKNLDDKWASRADLVRLITRQERADATDVAAKLRPAISHLPNSPFRYTVLTTLASRLTRHAQEELRHGQLARAQQIVWPLLSSNKLPGPDAIGKPVDLGDRLLDDPSYKAYRETIARVLSNSSWHDVQARGHLADMTGYWLATEIYRQHADLGTAQLLPLASQLNDVAPQAIASQVEHQPGTELSGPDHLLRLVLLEVATRAPDHKQQQTLVELITHQASRYDTHQDVKTLLGQYVNVPEDDGAEDDRASTARLVSPLNGIRGGDTKRNLLALFATGAFSVGATEFQTDAATFAQDANQRLQPFDRIGVQLASQVKQESPSDAAAVTMLNQLIERYAAADRWAAVQSASTTFYSPLPEPLRRWQTVNLRMRQAATENGRLTTSGRRLGDELHTQLKQALVEGTAIIRADGSETTRDQFVQLVHPIIQDYSSAGRFDLATAVLQAATDEIESLADWALWVQAELADAQAMQVLFVAGARLDGNPLPLVEPHQREIKLLDELIAKHPRSKWFSAAIERVIAIANAYPKYQSYGTALGVLNDFAKQHAELTVVARIEFAAAEIALSQAQDAFTRRDDKTNPPAALSPEYTAALDALAAMLKKYPTGQYAVKAEQQMFSVARVYAGVDAWPVVGNVLDRFAAAVPNYHDPKHLQFLQAVVWLGQLDRDYGAQLLTPAPSGEVGAASFESSLAMAPGDSPSPDAPVNQPDPVAAEEITTRLGTARPPVVAPGGQFGGFAGGGGALSNSFGFRQNGSSLQRMPNESALAMIRQSQRRQFQQLAMLENKRAAIKKKDADADDAETQQDGSSIQLPGGSLLSDAELKRQDQASDQAYKLLAALIKDAKPADVRIVAQARAQMMWLFGFFEGQLRADRSVALIRRFLGDFPTDPDRVALAWQAIQDGLVWAGQRNPADRVNLAWLSGRHELFEQVRTGIDQFVTVFADKDDWPHRAKLLKVESYEREATLAAAVSAVRASGLLVQSSEVLIELLDSDPDHPQAAGFPARLWNVAERLSGLKQQDAAIFVLSQIPIRFPTDPMADQSVLRIAQHYAVNLANPLRAVETYQEYLHVNGDNEAVRTHVFNIAQQLAGAQRYVESLHVFGVFVDSFPADPRAPEALRLIGRTHQDNEVWSEALASYERILDEYASSAVIPQVQLAMAECQINLSGWRKARTLYEEFAAKYPKDGQAAMAQSRVDVLKKLDRYQKVLADAMVERNKDDAQFQIARIVLQDLSNPVKAVAEFRKVIQDHPRSDLSDDAQLEIGKSLLALNRIDEAREELLKLPVNYVNSPLADDALYLIGQSFEQQATQLVQITSKDALAKALVRNQRQQYLFFNDAIKAEKMRQFERRSRLKQAGAKEALDLDEAANVNRDINVVSGNLFNANKQAEVQAETETTMQVANRQDRINEAYREAVKMYERAATEYPLGDQTDDSLLRIAQILETQLKDNAAAMETYQKIVKLFPGTPVAEDAAWKVALFYEREAKFAAASDAYRTFIRTYPASSRVADAQFALAEVLEELGKWVEAMDAYETFRQKFGQHPKAKVANEQINWIKTYRK